AHPYYQAKIREVDVNDVVSRIAADQKTIKTAAKELDVPYPALLSRVTYVTNRLFLPKWTEEETRKLMDYVQTNDSKPDYAYLSQLLGTKSPDQCRTK
ncbi:hypothetical protein H4S07_002737, partial [Coemansia furcata]